MNAAKKVLSIFFVLIFVSGCQGLIGQDQNEKVSQQEGSEFKETLSIEIKENEARFQLDELIEIVGGSYEYDEIHRTLQLTINDDFFYLIDDVPVLERNGEYVASEDIYLIIEEEEGKEEIYLPVEFLGQALGTNVVFEDERVSFEWFGPTERVGGPPETFAFDDWDVDQMVEYLSFLEKPIKGAKVSKVPSHLPGAPRAYRNGFHEGIDWYDFASGGGITTETPIYAMGDGVVVRADHDFVEYTSPEERNKDLAFTAELQDTPEYIFDRLRGRQVWVQYEGGVMNRFAHLHDIPSDLQVGDRVTADTIIGFVGNSGTSDGVAENFEAGLHLHQDLLIYGELFWKPLSQDEVLEVLERIWE
ncbi:M23 family metallopeptidase [Alkalihalobacillus sp. MEB130]|uniref:M23 family metallopeptidase n=1 Tax=Alkalihalobacillus sp. MEB130 TaxID=2976704 RepID=UPI0028E06229|nr:M23 family metallopeptidase [Alkalihalobacillus sp. MEB130]MDT8859184.1 M23 family metallopeptidase [Alkalihalobacillus sp. MEB130]